MIVDCHTHIACAAGDAEISEHLAAAETVDACIVLAAADDTSPDEVNKQLSAYVTRHREKIIGFGIVDPASNKGGGKSLKYISDKLDLEGVVLYCAAGGFHPAHTGAMRLYEAAEKLGLPVFFHNGAPLGPRAVLDYAQPYLLDEVARHFPGLKMVIGNMGQPFFEQTLAMLSKHENVYGDLTISPTNVWQVYNVVVAAHECGVMDKLLFGSGFPLGRAGECLETLLGFNKLLADTNLPTVPRSSIRQIIERDTLETLGIEKKQFGRGASGAGEMDE